jgi:hypothetical protein
VTQRRLSRIDVIAVVLYLSATLALGFADHRMRRHQEHVVNVYIPQVLAGTYGAPDIYRPLSPWLFSGFAGLTKWSPMVSFLVFRAVTIFGSLLALHLLLRTWFTATTSIGTTLSVAALMPLTFTNSWAHPDTFTELLIFSLGCRAVAERRDVTLGVILAIGMLNRETTGFLTMLWACDRWPERAQRTTLLKAGAYAAIVVAAYAGIRGLRGFEHYKYWMVSENLKALQLLPEGFDPYLRVGGLFWLLLLAVPAALALWAMRQPGVPSYMRAATLTAGAFLLVSLLLAAIIEVRVLTPLFPLLAPVTTWALLRFDDSG